MTPKHITAKNGGASSEFDAPLWFLICCVLLVVMAILLLSVVLNDRIYTSHLSPLVIAMIFFSLCGTVLLQARAWHLGNKGFHATEFQFESIYHHALEGILILNDQGLCLDANPATFALLGVPPEVLIGHSFAQFYADRFEFDLEWRRFLERSYRRGPVRLFRPDGSEIFADFTATANYVSGCHVVILSDTTERVLAQHSLHESKERLQQMADNIEEVFWLLDASTKEVLQVNRAYETITGRSLESLSSNPTSYVDMIHTDDRVRVFSKLEEASHSGHLDEEFRIVRLDGEIRWVSAHGFSVRDFYGARTPRLAGTVQDITARKLAESQIAKHVAAAERAYKQADAARAEAEALRKATLALTQNLRMDVVLDTLLACVSEIIPYERASVILTETDGRLFVARESPALRNRSVLSFDTTENVFLQRALVEKKGLHLSDIREETDWRDIKALAKIRSWIAVPLIVGGSVLGLLSVGATEPRRFTPEHFRLAKSLAIPAAVAIHNARLYEWAEIYAAERETLLKRAHAARSSQHPRDRFLQ